MRPIKFRAWDKEYEKITIPYSLNELLKGATSIHECFENDYIWTQFTGLHDRNGVEIYEGDILQMFYNNNKKAGDPFVVFWDEERAEFTKWSPRNSAEVIGNIYENGDLIK